MKSFSFVLATVAMTIGQLLANPLGALGQERPKAVKLLPENTVLYVQVDDLQELVEDMRDSNIGRMLQDEEVAPLVEALYGEALTAYDDVRDFIGVDLEDILALPKGEICFALVTLEDEDADPLAPVLFIDVDPDTDTAEKLLERGFEAAENDGASIESDKFEELTDEDGNEIEYREIRGDDGENAIIVRYQSTYLISNNKDLIADVLSRWMGQPPEKDRTLAENRKFVTIMNRCKGTKDEPAEMALFADPIAIAKAATRDNFAARAIMAGILPILGLDGLLGVGGSVIMDEEGFESVTHLHILLSNPKTGIFDMIALRPGIDSPEEWVPENAISYLTCHWDVKKLYRKLEEMIDQSNDDEGLMEREIEENINEELGIDFTEDIINQLEGRLTWVTWNERPARFNSQSNVLALKIKDPAKFQETLEIIMERVNEDRENMEEKSHQGYTYWQFPDSRIEDRLEFRRERQEERESAQVNIRIPQPSFGIVEDYFIFSESPKALRHIMETAKGDHASLADSEEYKTVMKHMKRQLGSEVPSLTLYSNAAEQLEVLFDALKADDVNDVLAEGAEENSFVAGIKKALEDHPLPDFKDIAKYFPPSGAFMTVDEAGYHFMAFQLRSDD